jgi:hypothetical protein
MENRNDINSSLSSNVRSNSSSTRSSSSSSGKTDIGTNLIDHFGGKEEIAGKMRHLVVSSVESKLNGVDVDQSLDQVMSMASVGLSKMRELSRNNPKLFWSGIASIVLGAGMVLGSARRPSVENTVEFESDMNL